MQKTKTRSRSGGFLGRLISDAIVPLSILGMQQTYKKKYRGGKHTRKHKLYRSNKKTGKRSRKYH